MLLYDGRKEDKIKSIKVGEIDRTLKYVDLYLVNNDLDNIIGINWNNEVHYYKYNFENNKLKIEGEVDEYRKIL